MQASFKRNLVLVLEALIAFISLQMIEYFITALNPVILGLIILLFSSIFFITTYIFIKSREHLTIQTELVN